jgi:hypothetical protein
MSPFVIIFDLDGTLGRKTPRYPDIRQRTGRCLRGLARMPETKLLIATGRPRRQAFIGFQHGGIRRPELYTLFAGGVYEDGLFVEDKAGKVYSALDHASAAFRRIRAGFVDEEAAAILLKHKFALARTALTTKRRPVSTDGHVRLYLQENDVRVTYKTLHTEIHETVKLFKDLERILRRMLTKRFPGWEGQAYLQRWEDAVELYPRLGESPFRKEAGVALLLERLASIRRNLRLVYCCDGDNDLTLVRYLWRHYPRQSLIVAPSNVGGKLRRELMKGKKKGRHMRILEADCENFCQEFSSTVLPELQRMKNKMM